MDGEQEPTNPGEFIRKALEERGLTQNDLAFILGIQQQGVNQLITGKRGISPGMAKSLGEVFGVSAEYLLKLQKASEVSRELAIAKGPGPEISQKAKLVTTYPIREMIKRGWLSAAPERIGNEMAQFFGVRSMEEIPHLDHAAKKSEYGETSPTQLAWLFRVKQIASRLVVPKYSEAALRDALPKLRELLSSPDAVSRVPRILQECGVRLVLVESLPGSKIDGVCFWLGNSPVIALSLRFDRIDNFWFVLRHEIEHVLRGHGKAGVMWDTDPAGDDADAESGSLPIEEQQANDAASDFCVPKAKMDSWIARKNPFFSEEDLRGFSILMGVHPGLVAGQLRYRIRKYHLFPKHLVKVRAAILKTAVRDGWGEIYPVT